MLKTLRQGANSWIVKVLLVLIALSFVVWGVGDDLGRGTRIPVVEAYNWSISPREFSQTYDSEFNRLRQQFGKSLDKNMADAMGLKQRALNSLINKYLIQDAGRNLRMSISPDELRRAIAENEVFQENGKFDKSRYDLLLRNNRMNPKDYEQMLRSEMLSAQLQLAIGSFAVTPDILVRDSFELANETRKIATLTLKPSALEKDFNPDDNILQEHLTRHLDNFMTNAEVKVRYILLNTDSVRDSITVTDEELQEHYDENRDNYIQKETREARHILVKTEGDVDDATALAKIKAAQQRIKDGETFEAVAKEVSDDISAAQGGSLGSFGRGMMVKPFEEVAFSLEIGQVSEPVKTQFGYHLISVDAIQPGKHKSFAEAKEEIRPVIIERKAANVVYDRSIIMEDQMFASGDLKGISGDLNLRYRETGYFSREDKSKFQGIEKDEKFLDAAFSTAKGDLSPIIELTNNRFFALEVIDKKAPEPKTLETARNEVLAHYRKQRSIEKAREIMTEVAKSLSEGAGWEEAAKINPAIINKDSAPFKRDGGKDAPSAAIRAAAFKLSLAKPDHQEVIEERDSFTIVRLKNIAKADQKAFAKETENMGPHLQRSLGYEQLTAYLNGLWRQSGIKINQQVLDQF